jgi:quinol monooxygenase YgiN
VYSLAMMAFVEEEDGFVILERYKDREAERRHLESERCVLCLERIREFIVGHESISYTVVDV